MIGVKLLVAVNYNTDNGKSDMKYVQTSFTVCGKSDISEIMCGMLIAYLKCKNHENMLYGKNLLHSLPSTMLFKIFIEIVNLLRRYYSNVVVLLFN